MISILNLKRRWPCHEVRQEQRGLHQEHQQETAILIKNRLMSEGRRIVNVLLLTGDVSLVCLKSNYIYVCRSLYYKKNSSEIGKMSIKYIVLSITLPILLGYRCPTNVLLFEKKIVLQMSYI